MRMYVCVFVTRTSSRVKIVLMLGGLARLGLDQKLPVEANVLLIVHSQAYNKAHTYQSEQAI